MTLPLNSRLSALYDTNGTQKDFSFGFRVFFDPDNGGYGLEVRRQTVDGYEVIPKSDYLVLPVEDNSAGVVRFSVAPSAGQQIYIAGKTPTIQQLVLTNFGRYSAESIETQFDFITAIIQEWLSALSEETRQRIAADQILTQYVVQRIDAFVQQVNQNWDDKSQEIEDYIDTIMPSFTQTLRDEIEAFAVAGMQDAIDQTLAESKAEIDDAVARANAAALAAAITGKVYDTPEAGVDPVTGVGNGVYYNVRSPNDDSYLDEYQNIGGVPTPTGKSYPSSKIVSHIQQHTALPYVTGKLYQLSERVQLANGDIVKSTIADNTANPNVDMTGWRLDNNTVESIADLIAIQNPKGGQVVYTHNSFFKFNPLTVSMNNTGTLFNGWERQYYQDVWLEWFGLTDGGNIADVLLKALPLAKLQHINFKCKKGNYFINKQIKVTDVQGFELDFNGSTIAIQYNTLGQPYNQFLYIDGIVDRAQSLVFMNSGTLKNVKFDGSTTDQNPETTNDSQLINGITIAGFKTINLYNFEAKNWAGQCTKFLVTNNINVENVLIENVGYASERDATGDAFYIGERDGLCFANFKNVVANGKEIFGSNSRIGITVENLNTALRQDAGCIITVEDSSFKHYNRFVHIESLLSGVKIFVKNSTIGADVVYFSLDLPLEVYSEDNHYSFYNKSYAGSTGMSRDTTRVISLNDTIDASQTSTVLGFDSVGSTYINTTINNPVAILASNLLKSKMIDCTINIDRDVGSLTYASEIPMYNTTFNSVGSGAYSVWDTPKTVECTFNNVKSGSLDKIQECEFYFDTSRAGFEPSYGVGIDAKIYHDNVIAYQPLRYSIVQGSAVGNATGSDNTATTLNALLAQLRASKIIKS